MKNNEKFNFNRSRKFITNLYRKDLKMKIDKTIEKMEETLKKKKEMRAEKAKTRMVTLKTRIEQKQKKSEKILAEIVAIQAELDKLADDNGLSEGETKEEDFKPETEAPNKESEDQAGKSTAALAGKDSKGSAPEKKVAAKKK